MADTEVLYTVAPKDGESRELHLTLSEAAEMILGHDGHEWAIRPDPDGGHSLWTSPFPRNSPAWRGLTRSVVGSPDSDPAVATRDIYQQVIERSRHWPGLDGMLQAEYEMTLELTLGDAVASGETDLEDFCRRSLAEVRADLTPRTINAP